jgi:holo-[acyl-carrier protein] synthase
MEIYTGIDIIEVERIKNNIEQNSEKFLSKIYTNKEIEYCESKNVNKYQSYAGRFAGKEATLKAISKLLDNKYQLGWKDIEILNESDGRPQVLINSELNLKQNFKMDISISHISKTAVASVVIVKE